ncbi:MAG: hypothetical protein WEB62_05880 [Bacteroidota bacterium]
MVIIYRLVKRVASSAPTFDIFNILSPASRVSSTKGGQITEPCGAFIQA